MVYCAKDSDFSKKIHSGYWKRLIHCSCLSVLTPPMTYVLLYLVVVLVCIVLYSSTKAIYIKRLKSVYEHLDTFFYEFHVFLHIHKSNIYKFSQSLPVLFAHKHRLFEEKNISLPILRSYLPLLSSDAEFLEQLVAPESGWWVRAPIVSNGDMFRYRVTRFFKICIVVLTLGIGLVFLR